MCFYLIILWYPIVSLQKFISVFNFDLRSNRYIPIYTFSMRGSYEHVFFWIEIVWWVAGAILMLEHHSYINYEIKCFVMFVFAIWTRSLISKWKPFLSAHSEAHKTKRKLFIVTMCNQQCSLNLRSIDLWSKQDNVQKIALTLSQLMSNLWGTRRIDLNSMHRNSSESCVRNRKKKHK